MSKFDALLDNDMFVSELEKVETIEDAVSLFAKENVVVTAEELNNYLAESQKEDLSETDLDNVAGGCIICVGVRIVRAIIKSRKRSSGTGAGGGFSSGGGGGGGGGGGAGFR